MFRWMHAAALMLAALVFLLPRDALAGRFLFVSDTNTDSNIPTVLRGDGHTVDVVINDYNATTTNNARLQTPIGAYDTMIDADCLLIVLNEECEHRRFAEGARVERAPRERVDPRASPTQPRLRGAPEPLELEGLLARALHLRRGHRSAPASTGGTPLVTTLPGLIQAVPCCSTVGRCTGASVRKAHMSMK